MSCIEVANSLSSIVDVVTTLFCDQSTMVNSDGNPATFDESFNKDNQCDTYYIQLKKECYGLFQGKKFTKINIIVDAELVSSTYCDCQQLGLTSSSSSYVTDRTTTDDTDMEDITDGMYDQTMESNDEDTIADCRVGFNVTIEAERQKLVISFNNRSHIIGNTLATLMRTVFTHNNMLFIVTSHNIDVLFDVNCEQCNVTIPLEKTTSGKKMIACTMLLTTNKIDFELIS